MAVQAMQQKRCPLSSALSGLCKGGGARQTLPHRCGAPRHEVFPAMVRVLWQRMGANVQTGHGRSGATKSQHPKKQGMASQITGVAGRCFWGWMRSPLHFSPKACVSGFFKEPREGSPMPHLTGFFLTTCTGAPCPTWSAIQGGHDAGRRHPVGRPLAA